VTVNAARIEDMNDAYKILVGDVGVNGRVTQKRT
jgi:hypothetical protein